MMEKIINIEILVEQEGMSDVYIPFIIYETLSFIFWKIATDFWQECHLI